MNAKQLLALYKTLSEEDRKAFSREITDEELLTVKQVMALLHVSRPTVDRYIRLGIFQARHFGTQVRIVKSSVMEALHA